MNFFKYLGICFHTYKCKNFITTDTYTKYEYICTKCNKDRSEWNFKSENTQILEKLEKIEKAMKNVS